jgi:hypothetical protein
MRTLAALLIVGSLTVLAGCGSANRQGSQDAVARFYAAVHRQDGASACELLAPATRTAVAQAAKATCAKGLLTEQLPAPGPVRSAVVYGDQAQVRLRGDTVFVATFPTGWRIVAAGCKPRQDRPYDCEVEAD